MAMHPWHSVALSAAGRVPLEHNESLARVQARVGLYSADFRHPHPLDSGSAQVTSHRLLFIPAPAADTSQSLSQSALSALAIRLRDIRQTSFSQGFLRSSPKITLHVQSSPNSAPAAAGGNDPGKQKPLPQLPWTCHVCQHAHLLPAELARDSCSQCGNRRLPSLPCPSCTFANALGSASCSMCGSSLATPPTSPAANANANASGATITCTRCTLINPLSAASCAACGSALSSSLASSTSSVDPTGVVMIKLSFRGGGEKGFHQALLAAMRARAWEADQGSSSSPTSRSAAGGRVADSPTLASSSPSLSPAVKPLGLSGIVAKQEQEQLTQQSALSTAFSDLDALMSKAQDMVALSSTIAAKLKRSTSSTSSTDTTPDSLISEFRTYLLSLGATSALAGSELAALGKRATGDDRDRALAREVGDFLLHVLPARGGLLSMGDVYCMFNRARGVALVSPQDLWVAAQMFEAVGVRLRARQLESGARVVHTDRFEDARVFDELTRWLTEEGDGDGAGGGTGGWVGLSALEVAERLGGGVSVALARQLLEHAVRAGVVVVDVPGSRYYVNVWNDQAVTKG